MYNFANPSVNLYFYSIRSNIIPSLQLSFCRKTGTQPLHASVTTWKVLPGDCLVSASASVCASWKECSWVVDRSYNFLVWSHFFAIQIQFSLKPTSTNCTKERSPKSSSSLIPELYWPHNSWCLKSLFIILLTMNCRYIIRLSNLVKLVPSHKNWRCPILNLRRITY